MKGSEGSTFNPSYTDKMSVLDLQDPECIAENPHVSEALRNPMLQDIKITTLKSFTNGLGTYLLSRVKAFNVAAHHVYCIERAIRRGRNVARGSTFQLWSIRPRDGRIFMMYTWLSDYKSMCTTYTCFSPLFYPRVCSATFCTLYAQKSPFSDTSL